MLADEQTDRQTDMFFTILRFPSRSGVIIYGSVAPWRVHKCLVMYTNVGAQCDTANDVDRRRYRQLCSTNDGRQYITLSVHLRRTKLTTLGKVFFLSQEFATKFQKEIPLFWIYPNLLPTQYRRGRKHPKTSSIGASVSIEL